MTKFKPGDRVRIVGIPWYRRLLGLRNFHGDRMYPPSSAVIRFWRPEMDAYEVVVRREGRKCLIMETWYFEESKMVLVSDPRERFARGAE